MRTEQRQWARDQGWDSPAALNDAHLVLAFGSPAALQEPGLQEGLRQAYPEAHLMGCSTAGEIQDTQVSDDALVVTAIRFQGTRLETSTIDLAPDEASEDAGRRLAEGLPKDGLRHVMVLSDGVHVNGSSLVEGMQDALPKGVQITGGLAGDGDRFDATSILADDGIHDRGITALGLYGDQIEVRFGSLGGWDPFGPLRRVTRSHGNVLYELDGRPALGLYKEYLGDQAAGLPATGLLFPLSIRTSDDRPELTRTILAVDEEAQSLTFAGDIPEGSLARLMKANFDRLIDGAHGAAENSRDEGTMASARLAILISCVGRKLVLKQRVEEEVEAVRDVLGPEAALTGFYSYGEICPAAPGADCELHNQTMTITTLREVTDAQAA